MQKVFVSSWCDYPGCSDAAIAAGAPVWEGQKTRNIQTWFYPPGKGHKPRIIANDLCVDHFNEVLSLRDKLKDKGTLVGAAKPEADE